ncbi:MAG TPA: hypothetical protein PK894_04350 [Defluviitoga sp.]|nr:hypothetical protein [Defluviitoga sp.]HOP23798.1 hypothetical protein [Defluviitoga sp.]HPZ28455.1 hypothetical protein [Defluviitoga sp.]HQD62811.1 hypothetical protein [Defluviitoga sp.]
MIFLETFLLNTVALISAFNIIKMTVLKNRQIYAFTQFFNVYGAMAFLLLLSYVKFATYYLIVLDFLSFCVLMLFYIRAFDASNKKFHERFKVIILSFGYNKKTYFNTFLSKKLLARGFEAYFAGIGFFYLVNKLFFLINDPLNPLMVIIPSISFFFASVIKISKNNKVYKFLM